MSDPNSSKPIEDRGEASLPHLRERAEPSATGGKFPTWLLVAAGLVAATGFAYLGKHVSSIDNGEFLQPNYVAIGPQDGANEAVEKTPLEQQLASGARLYNTCQGCHGPAGAGGSGIPPLSGSEWVSGPTQRFGMIIMHGVAGPITVEGQGYNSNMPPQGGNMSAKDLSDVMTFVRVKFGDQSMIEAEHLVISEEVASNIMAVDHSGQMSASELESKHSVYAEGQTLDPDTGEPT